MAARRKGLWGHDNFLRLWSAQAISTFGARIAREGLPMAAVITLKAGPQSLGLLAALALAGQAGFGLFAGALADRLPKKPLLIAADLARAAVLLAVPAAALLGRLSLVEIYVAAALMGALSVAFDVADHAFLPSLIAPADLLEGNSKLATTEAVSEVGGPALAGALFQLLSPPIALALNAATYVASALLLGAVRAPRATPAQHAEAAPGLDLAAGVRIVLAHPLLRPLWLGDVTRGLFGGFFSALYILFAIGTLRLTPGMLGLTIACGGAGGLVGATLAPALTRRLGAGRAIVVTGFSGGAMLFLIPLAHGSPLLGMAFLALAQVLGDALQTVMGVTAVSLRQSVLPPHQLGRAGGAFMSAGAAAGVFGALLGGALGAAIGPRDALYIAAAGIVVGSLFALFSPLRTASATPA
jgi:MFS family permease